jgi:drug/metabolite transporter (DMT)-like permease
VTLLMCLVGTISMAVVAVPGLALTGGAAAAHVIDTPATAWWFLGEIVVGSTLIAQTAYASAVRHMGVAGATIGAEYTALFVGVAWSLAVHEAWTPLTVAAGAVFCAALTVTFVPLPRALRRRAGESGAAAA